MFMCRLFIAQKPASDDSEIGSLMSLNEFRPVFTFETIEEPSSLVMYTVIRSASNSWQRSRETSRMISSMFAVEWTRLVTACSFFENASFALMSATLADPCIFGSRTALILWSPFRPRVSSLGSRVFLQHEFLVVLEHARSPAPRRLSHFLHRERPFPRLQV